MTASVWHRPAVQEEVKDRLAERQARAAVALVRMGKAEEIWPLLRHSADPRLRSFIINWLQPLGRRSEGDRRRARPQIHSLARPVSMPGGPRRDHAGQPENGRRSVPSRDLAAAGADPRTGDIRHGRDCPPASVSHWPPSCSTSIGMTPTPASTARRNGHCASGESGQIDKAADAELMKLKDWGGRRWFVNGQGQTFAVIDGPVEFRMGSPPNEPGAKRRPRVLSPHGHPPPFRHRRQGGNASSSGSGSCSPIPSSGCRSDLCESDRAPARTDR